MLDEVGAGGQNLDRGAGGGPVVDVEIVQGRDRGHPGGTDPQADAGGVASGHLACQDRGEVALVDAAGVASVIGKPSRTWRPDHRERSSTNSAQAIRDADSRETCAAPSSANRRVVTAPGLGSAGHGGEHGARGRRTRRPGPQSAARALGGGRRCGLRRHDLLHGSAGVRTHRRGGPPRRRRRLPSGHGSARRPWRSWRVVSVSYARSTAGEADGACCSSSGPSVAASSAMRARPDDGGRRSSASRRWSTNSGGSGELGERSSSESTARCRPEQATRTLDWWGSPATSVTARRPVDTPRPAPGWPPRPWNTQLA